MLILIDFEVEIVHTLGFDRGWDPYNKGFTPDVHSRFGGPWLYYILIETGSVLQRHQM